MTESKFIRLIEDIWDAQDDRLKDYASALEEKILNYRTQAKKNFLFVIIVIVGYYLVTNAIIDSVKIGPFLINDIKAILGFVPFVVAYLINNAITNFSNAYNNNFFLSVVLQRYYGLKENTALLSRILPLSTEHPSLRKNGDKEEFNLGSCLIKIPLVLFFLILGLLIIPYYYYFVITIIIETYYQETSLGLWTFWLPNSIAVAFLLMGLNTGIQILRFVASKSLLQDLQDEMRENNLNKRKKHESI